MFSKGFAIVISTIANLILVFYLFALAWGVGMSNSGESPFPYLFMVYGVYALLATIIFKLFVKETGLLKAFLLAVAPILIPMVLFFVIPGLLFYFSK